jgi:hypothetical protein
MKRLIFLFALLLSVSGTAAEPQVVDIVVRETAGIKRFGYPVSAEIELPREIGEKDQFRLLASGKAVPGQFRPVAGKAKRVTVDFNQSCGPFAETKYKIEFGPEVKSNEGKGLIIEEGKEEIVIRSGGMSYVAPKVLGRLLNQVRDGKKEYLTADKGGLTLLSAKGTSQAIASSESVTITRQGPLVAALLYRGVVSVDEVKIPWTLSMTYPRSKSWVEGEWILGDGGEAIKTMEAQLGLLIKEGPALVDFGASTTVYTTLKSEERVELLSPWSKRHWGVVSGSGAKLTPFVLPTDAMTQRPEGWAHVMDRQRCTALALADFAAEGNVESIGVSGNGDLRFSRTFAEKKARRLKFWLHFVNMPVQIGALTSPQAMQNPLTVEQK